MKEKKECQPGKTDTNPCEECDGTGTVYWCHWCERDLPRGETECGIDSHTGQAIALDCVWCRIQEQD